MPSVLKKPAVTGIVEVVIFFTSPSRVRTVIIRCGWYGVVQL